MKNTMIPEKAQTITNEIVEKVKELIDLVEPPKNEETLEKLTELEQVHTLVVLKTIGELRDYSFMLKSFFEDSEEELTELFTDDGKVTLTEAKLRLMLSMMAEATGFHS